MKLYKLQDGKKLEIGKTYNLRTLQESNSNDSIPFYVDPNEKTIYYDILDVAPVVYGTDIKKHRDEASQRYNDDQQKVQNILNDIHNGDWSSYYRSGKLMGDVDAELEDERRQYYDNYSKTLMTRAAENHPLAAGFANAMPFAIAPFAAPEAASTIFGALGVQNLIGKNGVRKTYRHLKNSEWGSAAKSAVGDLFDLAMVAGGVGGAMKMGRELTEVLPATRKWATARTVTRELNNNIKYTNLKPSVVDENILSGKLGWAPSKTKTLWHASNNEDLKVLDPTFKAWDMEFRGAPIGHVWMSGNDTKAGFLGGRPYHYKGSVTINKPMVQLGESVGKGKNKVRNQILQFADNAGADAVNFQGIADNTLKNQDIYSIFKQVEVNPKLTLFEKLGLNKSARKNLTRDDLLLGKELGRGDEATVYNTNLTNRYVIKEQRPSGRPIDLDYVEKSLNIPKYGKQYGTKTYYLGKLRGKNYILQEKVKTFDNADDFTKLLIKNGFDRSTEGNYAVNKKHNIWWMDSNASNAGIGADGNLKIIDGIVDELFPAGSRKLYTSPTTGFTYWQKYPIIGWRQREFKPVNITLETKPSEKSLYVTPTKPLVKYYGPTMGKTTAAKTNTALVDFDDVIRLPARKILDKFGFKTKADMFKSGNIDAITEYRNMLISKMNEFRHNSANSGKTLLVSPAPVINPEDTGFYFDNIPTLPSRDVFIQRNVGRGGTWIESADWYDNLLKRNPNVRIDDRFISEIPTYEKPTTEIKSFTYSDPVAASPQKSWWFGKKARAAQKAAYEDMVKSGMTLYDEDGLISGLKVNPDKRIHLEDIPYNSYRGYTTSGKLRPGELSIGDDLNTWLEPSYDMKSALSWKNKTEIVPKAYLGKSK